MTAICAGLAPFEDRDPKSRGGPIYHQQNGDITDRNGDLRVMIICIYDVNGGLTISS